MNLAKNIKFLAKKHRIGQTALARATGVPQPTMNRIWSGGGEPRYSTLRVIADYFHMTVEDLRYADLEQDAKKVATSGFDPNVVSPAAVGARPIPVISGVQAGALTEASDPYPVGAGYDVLYTSTEMSKHAFALDIKGDSMLPEFHPGDRVIIDPEVPPQPGDFVVAKNAEEEATFKKYKPITFDQLGNVIFKLVPLNTDYPELQSDVSKLRIIGVMVEHRKYRKRK